MVTTTEPASKQKNKAKADKKMKVTQSSTVDKLKVAVRRLPPNLPGDIFWQSVQPWVTDETVSWRAYYPGKIRKSYNVNKGNIPSRAYIAFRTVEQLATFGQAYDGHIFRDKSGNEFFAVVEFAPFQKIPPEKRKVDTRVGTIEQDEDYKSFIAALSAPTTKPSETETIEALVAASQPPEQPKTTPLLDALRAEKQAQRDKETILKAHAHYRDRAKEDRKRGKQPQASASNARDENVPSPGQGKRNRRGKKVEATGALAPKAKAKEVLPVPSTAKTTDKPSGFQQEPVVSARESGKEVPQKERRPRPGLASRQFEVALAGAGVLTNSGSDRKTPQGREQEKDMSEAATADASQKSVDKVGGKLEKPRAPASPGKERSRGGRKRGNSTKGHVAPAVTNGAESTSGTTPTILARPGSQPGILTRLATTIDAPASESVAGQTSAKRGGRGSAMTGEGRGGRRRGRGKAAVRGGPPGGGS